MRLYTCPSRACPVLERGLMTLLDHLGAAHGMRGWDVNVSAKTMRWAKTGQVFPLVWVNEADIPAPVPDDAERANAMALQLVDAELRAMGLGGLQ